MPRLNARAQQRVVETWRHKLEEDPKHILADLVHNKTITNVQAQELVKRRVNVVEMLKIQRRAMSHKREAESTRDPSFYGLAGKLFADAADHAMKAGLNSYAALFLNEAINAKKVAGVPEEEIFVFKQTIKGLMD